MSSGNLTKKVLNFFCTKSWEVQTYTTEVISMVETNDLIINSIPAEGATITVKTKEKNGFNITGDTYFTCTWTGWYDRIFTIKPNTSGEPVEFNIAMWDNDNPDDIRMLVTFKQGK